MSIVQPSQPGIAANISCHASAICCEENTALSTLNWLMGGLTIKLPVSWDLSCLRGIIFLYRYSATYMKWKCSLPDKLVLILPCEVKKNMNFFGFTPASPAFSVLLRLQNKPLTSTSTSTCIRRSHSTCRLWSDSLPLCSLPHRMYLWHGWHGFMCLAFHIVSIIHV